MLCFFVLKSYDINHGGCDAASHKRVARPRRGDEASRLRELMAFVGFVSYKINHERKYSLLD